MSGHGTTVSMRSPEFYNRAITSCICASHHRIFVLIVLHQLRERPSTSPQSSILRVTVSASSSLLLMVHSLLRLLLRASWQSQTLFCRDAVGHAAFPDDIQVFEVNILHKAFDRQIVAVSTEGVRQLRGGRVHAPECPRAEARCVSNASHTR